jgi:hypothetical protein
MILLASLRSDGWTAWSEHVDEFIGLRSQQRWLNDFALRFCPRLWKWLGDTVGTKARAVLIDLYGLYGSRGRKMDSLARKLETTTQNVVELRDKALRQIRIQQNQAELEELIVSTAQSILAVYQKDAAERGE